MSGYKEITLLKGREQSLHRRHPWIFSGAVKFKPADIADGDLVYVKDHKGQCCGTGIYQDGSIMVRMLDFEQTVIDHKFWHSRLENAARYRKEILHLPSEKTNAFRLFHGEGDGVSGLIIDIYGTTAVIQCHNLGIYRMLENITQALTDVMQGVITSVYSKSKETLPSNFAHGIRDGYIFGTSDMAATIFENEHRFVVNWQEGQKTGFFLDQRDNRQLVGMHCKGKSVLNCFSYTGGFSVYAGVMGASHVVSIDISTKAINLANENASINKLPNHEGVVDNVLEYLTKNEATYDVVIVDPPAFAKSLSKRHNAVQAYKRLNILAMKAVKPGGLLFTFSCSQVVSTQLFYDTIVAAGIEAGREVRVMHHLSQGADHPVNLFHPEGHYLKGLMVYEG
ncbi:MAG: class I SAM-dependent rRNA methyltransferase [Saprospiraceae bacterium]|nr:class I SAM-dependent rRNA methyltransferase [Saprospiraceae bacterium]